MVAADVTELNPLVAGVEMTAWPTFALVSDAHHPSRDALARLVWHICGTSSRRQSGGSEASFGPGKSP